MRRVNVHPVAARVFMWGALAMAAGGGLGWAARRSRGRVPRPLPPLVRVDPGGPDTLLADAGAPRGPVALLWYEGRGTQPTADGRRSVVDGGHVLVIDAYLGLRQPAIAPGRVLASAVETAGGWLAITEDGDLLRSIAGRIDSEIAAPFDVTSLASDREGGAMAVRSAGAVSFRRLVGQEPLLVRLDSAGTSIGAVGGTTAPSQSMLGELANAGWVAVHGDTIFFASLIRDEVLALGRGGDTLWRATRGLSPEDTGPRFAEHAGMPTIDYSPVTEGLALGPDGNVYVLGPDVGGSRLDVFHPESGRHLRTAHLEGELPTIAINALGRLYSIDPFRVLGGPPVAERKPAPAFDLQRIGGGRVTTAALQGRVTLVNFWASWCAPCREELPALDTLRRSINDSAFAFLAVNEDVDVADAEEFLEELGFDFAVALGRGEMRYLFHNRGIPFTVLFDREGRIARQWLGYGGPEHMAILRTVIDEELRRGR